MSRHRLTNVEDVFARVWPPPEAPFENIHLSWWRSPFPSPGMIDATASAALASKRCTAVFAGYSLLFLDACPVEVTAYVFLPPAMENDEDRERVMWSLAMDTRAPWWRTLRSLGVLEQPVGSAGGCNTELRIALDSAPRIPRPLPMLAGQIAFAGATLVDDSEGGLWAYGGSHDQVTQAASVHPLGASVMWAPSILDLLGEQSELARIDPTVPASLNRSYRRSAEHLIASAMQLDGFARSLERYSRRLRKRQEFALRLASALLELDGLLDRGASIETVLAKLDPVNEPDPLSSIERLAKALRRQVRYH